MKRTDWKVVLSVLLGLILVACQSDRDSNDPDTTGSQQENSPIVEEAPQELRRRYEPRQREPREEDERGVRALEPVQEFLPQYIEGRLPQDGPGLGLIIDASNLDAFHQSLELIASETSEPQYRELQGSLDMLGFYDMEAQGWEGLLPILDGMTGEDVIRRAERIRFGE